LVLLALTEGLFDEVPLQHMGKAEQAVQQASEILPDALHACFTHTEKLTPQDRQSLVTLLEATLQPFVELQPFVAHTPP
ncbi:MAG: F0F1 ATP synthase subunit alpha, partial [Limnobacter sp.]|nr:F0F1 ATP synthase subunit alpha [Limnobacter sp.]